MLLLKGPSQPLDNIYKTIKFDSFTVQTIDEFLKINCQLGFW